MNTKNSEPMWMTVGYTEDFCARALKNMRTAVQDDPRLPLDSPNTSYEARSFPVDESTVIAVLKHLGVAFPDDNLSDWEPLARKVPDRVVQIFYGSWRDGYRYWPDEPPLTVDECRQRLPWIDVLRYGLLWSLFFDDEKNLAKIVQWPDEDLREDEGMDDLKNDDCRYYILLCKWLRGSRSEISGKLGEAVRGSVNRRPRFLLNIVEAIDRKDSDAYGKAMLEYLKYYRQAEFQTRSIRRCISVDGAILWHIARRSGLDQPALPERLQYVVLTRQTLPVGG